MVDVKMSRAPLGEGKNWVTEAGGLPPRWRGVVRHLQARGYDESRAIATAVNWAKKQCATGRAFGGKVPVGAEARAQACREVAEWERKKAQARATPNKSDMAVTPCGCQETVDLAAWDGAKHPRVSKGKSGGGRFAAKSGQQKQQASAGPLPPEMAAQVRDFQRRHGLAQTGTFDAATTASVHYHASGAAAKAAAGSKRHARAVLSAQKRAARRKTAALRKAGRAKASAAKKAARAKASAARKRAQAQAAAINELTAAQRAAYRKRVPSPPSGYVWGARDRLVAAPTVTQAQASAQVAKAVGLAEQVKAIDLASDPAKLTLRQRLKLRRKGQAMAPASPGGQPRFPIRNRADLAKAVRAVGRAKGDHGKVRAHIIRRARAIGAADMIPDGWQK